MIVEELVTTGDPKLPAANRVFALDPATGHSIWERELGPGAKPGGFATATPAVVEGLVYISGIVDGTTQALSVKDGSVKWTTKVPGAGAGLVVGDRTVYVAAGPKLVALSRAEGKAAGSVEVGGFIGPATPLLAGDTIFVTNLYGWIHAVPVSAFTPR